MQKSVFKSIWLSILLIAAALVCFVGCNEWQHNVTVRGVFFEKIRLEDSGLAIGKLKEDTTIAGRQCKAGWVHLFTNGVPAGFTSANPIVTPRFTIPPGTWVKQNINGVITICSFPADTEIQGHVCRGSGGPAGIQAAFYPSGALKQYFLRQNTVIQGIPCKAGLFSESIELHENGCLKACVLSEDATIGGIVFKKGQRIQLDTSGHVVP